MKKFIFSAVAVLALAGATVPALTFNATQIAGKDKPKPTQPAPDTNSIPPGCPLSDPNGCGILD